MSKTITAPAKVNLTLRVLRKRSDNYHEIQSLVGFTQFGDVLTIHDGASLELHVNGPFASAISAGEDNLVIKAIRLVEAYINRSIHWHITITKNIPVQAGLGGGSADAGAILRLCQELYALPKKQIEKMAASLGADVTACIYSRPCMMEGIGERVTFVENMPRWYMVLVNNHQLVSTKAIYACGFPLKESQEIPKEDMVWKDYVRYGSNDMQPNAISVSPSIEEVLVALRKTNMSSVVRMSGSGGTCYGLYETESHAMDAARDIQEKHPNWWVKHTCLTGSEET